MISVLTIFAVISHIKTQTIYEGTSSIQYHRDLMRVGQIITSLIHYQDKLYLKLSNQDVLTEIEALKVQHSQSEKKIENLTTKMQNMINEMKKDHKNTNRMIANMTREMKKNHEITSTGIQNLTRQIKNVQENSTREKENITKELKNILREMKKSNEITTECIDYMTMEVKNMTREMTDDSEVTTKGIENINKEVKNIKEEVKEGREVTIRGIENITKKMKNLTREINDDQQITTRRIENITNEMISMSREVKEGRNITTRKIDHMTKEMKNMTKEVKEDRKITTSGMAKMTVELENMSRELRNITMEMKKEHDIQIQELQIMFNNQDSMLFSQNKTLQTLQKRINELENRSAVSGYSSTSSSPFQSDIAFYVISNRNQNSGVVVFDQVITNIGDRYDNSTGIFSVALSGVYVFSWNVETISQLTNTTLEVNGIAKGAVAADEKSGSYYDTSTSFAVLELKAGDQVNVRVNTGRALSGGTAFSGWRLKGQRSAFYASLSRKDSSNRYKFDNVYTNKDLVYSTSTGKFRVESPGLYILTTSLSAYSSSSMLNSFIYIKNGSTPVKSHLITSNSYSGHYDTTATMTLAYLKKGEEVYVGESSAAATSMFAGWLAAPGTLYNYPAFTASLKSDSSSTPLVFNKIHVSPHTGYSLSTGKFIVDRPGVYVFFWNIRATGRLVKSALRVNTRDVGGTRSEGRTGQKYDDSSSVAVVQLSSGDQVYVRIITGPADEDQSAFCGWLLYDN